MMPTDSPSPARDLIERLENATEGSRELDAAIYAHVCGGKMANIGPHGWMVLVPYASETIAEDPKPFSRSLDAALTLVPKGCAVDLHYFPGTADVPAGKYFNAAAAVWFADRGKRFRADSYTMPLALCIAALKARTA